MQRRLQSEKVVAAHKQRIGTADLASRGSIVNVTESDQGVPQNGGQNAANILQLFGLAGRLIHNLAQVQAALVFDVFLGPVPESERILLRGCQRAAREP